jgi:hypothetical protein
MLDSNLRPRALLEGALSFVEDHVQRGQYHTLLARKLVEACTVLDFADLATSARALLQKAPDSAFFAGAIMNFVPDSGAVARMRRGSTIEEIQRSYPWFKKSDIERMARSQEATRFAWERNYRDALDVAPSQDRASHETPAIVEVALTAAVLGDFAIAEDILQDEHIGPGPVHLGRIVLAIEYTRAGLYAKANATAARIQLIGPWEAINFALGFSGRQPWPGYPYPDY